ncbi:MAG: sulfotransferase family 2 domain-containing protein, partial [Planctomycetota bacterium]|nr:sulfotransferase family 2 domain-containing protein [Planctomycetota bacterium]
HKILYCPIEKNSCTLFKRILILNSEFSEQFIASTLDPHTFLKQTGLMKPENATPFQDADYLRFIIVREPLERIVSAYMNKFVRSKRYKIALKITQDYRRQFDQPYDENRLLNFSEFVQHISEQTNQEMDVHWRPQIDFVRHEIELFQYKVTMERIAEFISILSRRMGVELDASKTANQNHYAAYPPGMNFHITPPEELRQLKSVPEADSLLTPELRNVLTRRYARDIELYQECVDSRWPG